MGAELNLSQPGQTQAEKELEVYRRAIGYPPTTRVGHHAPGPQIIEVKPLLQAVLVGTEQGVLA